MNYYLIRINKNGVPFRSGPYLNAHEQKSVARAMMHGGELVLFLDVQEVTGEPHVGMVKFEDSPTADTQFVAVDVLCGKPIDGGRCAMLPHEGYSPCSRWTGP